MINSEMCRQQINKFFILIFVLGVFGLNVLYVQSGFLGDFLSEMSDKLTNDDYIHSIGGKSVITDIYYKSLDIARTNDISAIDKSIDMSVDYMKSKYSQCNLNKSDMLNILYNSNDSFKRSFKQNITNNYKTKPEYPTNADYLASCYVFMGCFYGISDYKNSPYILQNCSKQANDIYFQMYLNYYSIASFDQINFGDDVFWNGKLDDADYDLLYDIDIIGKILFEGSKTPPEVLYYQFPDVDNLGGDGNVSVPYDGTIDRFSPYDPGDFPDTNLSGDNSGSGSGDNSANNGNLNNEFGYGLQDGTLDQEIQAFLESNSSSTYVQNQYDNSNILNGNMCITGLVQQQENPGFVFSGDLQQYLSGLIKEINENQGNGSITTGGGSLISGNIVNLTGDEALTQIENQIEMLSNIDDAVSQEAIQGCINQCDGLPIDDKAICIVKCTCTEFSSPAYNDILKAGTFKVKFCMVPVQNKGFSKNGKTVYSIEEIYNEVLGVLVSLRDSGELLVSKKTKEFLESSMTKNKFGNIFSFSISTSFKSLFTNTDRSIVKREEEAFLKNIQKSVLCYGDSLASSNEANKYILLSDPQSEISKNEIIQSSSFGQNKGCDQLVDPSKLLQEDRLIKLNSIVFEFLKTHTVFWQDVVEMMKEINQTAESLSKK